MVFHRAMILVLYMCYKIEHSDNINEAQAELFRQSCPYTNFCSSNSPVVLGQTDRTPCCMDCFCDSACLSYGDCCPDLMLDGPKGDDVQNLQPVCKEVVYKNEFSKEANYSGANRAMYRVIDECPPEYSDGVMTREKCAENYTGPTTYDDIVMVSGDDFRLFQNKHCARCHGVKQLTRWHLQVLKCKDDLQDVNLAASKVQEYIIQNCILWPSRPASVPLNGRTMQCDLMSICQNIGDKNIREICINGPFMPYRFDNSLGNAWFRNVMCFQCLFGNVFEVLSECRAEDMEESKSTIQGYRILLDLPSEDNDVTITRSSKCGEAETYDQYSDGCRRMYCPPLSVAQYGRCVPMSKQISNLYVGLNVLFTPEDTDVILNYQTIYSYNKQIEQFYLDRIREKVNLEKCHISAYIVEIARKPSSGRVEFLNVKFNIYIDDNCSLEYLGNHIRDVQAAIRQTWLINNDTVPMKGRYYFGLLGDGNVYRKDIILHKTDTVSQDALIDRFFVCPYFSLSVSEYNERIFFHSKGSQNILINKLTPQTVLKKGYYAISRTRIAVCVPANSRGYFYKPRFIEIILFLYFYIFFL